VSQTAGSFVSSGESERKESQMRIVRFLIGSALLLAGWMIVPLAAVTVVGLPIGLIVLGAGLQLMVAPSNR
jgi:hypothetical protein